MSDVHKCEHRSLGACDCGYGYGIAIGALMRLFCAEEDDDVAAKILLTLTDNYGSESAALNAIEESMKESTKEATEKKL